MSAVTLNPLAVSASDLLRAIKAGGWASKAELAQAAGRLPNHIARDLRALETAGLILQPNEPAGAILLSDDGIAQLAAIDRAEEPAATDEPGLPLPDGLVGLLHCQFIPDPDQARTDWDSPDAIAELEGLADNLFGRGRILQNLIARPTELTTIHPIDGSVLPVVMINGGERRWRATGLLIERYRLLPATGWPETRPLPALVMDGDELAHVEAGVTENLQKRDLNPIEKAKAFERLNQMGRSNQEIAALINKTDVHVQQHRSFLRLSELDQARMILPKEDKKRLTVREAREMVTAMNRAEAQAREPAPELDVSPIERLTAAEILHAVHARANYTYDDIEVGPDAKDDPFLQALVEARMFQGPSLRRHGVYQGRWVVSIAHGFPFPAFPTLRAGEAEDFDAGLAGEQARLEAIAGTTADVTEDRRYVTTWLNGPFEISPEGQAVFDAVAEEQRAQTERLANEVETRAQIEAAHATARARSRALFEQTRVATAAGRLDALDEIVIQAEAKTPWRISQAGNVVAADGQEIIRNGGAPQSEARLRLMVLAVNAAARVETPVDDEPEPLAADLDEEGFVDAMTSAFEAADDAIEYDAARARAQDLLASNLAENGCEFGDDGWIWTADGAAEMVAHDLSGAEEDAD